MDVVARHFPGKDVHFVLHRDLSEKIAHTNCYWTDKHLLPVLRYPHEVHFQVRFRVRTVSVPPHATTIPRASLRLKARGFNHPRRGH